MLNQGYSSQCMGCPYKDKADKYDSQQKITNYKPEQKRMRTLEERQIEEMRNEMNQITRRNGARRGERT